MAKIGCVNYARFPKSGHICFSYFELNMYATDTILSSDNSIVSSIIQAYNKYQIAWYIYEGQAEFWYGPLAYQI